MSRSENYFLVLLARTGAELQRRSSKVLEKHSLFQVGNLYQLSSTLGPEPLSIVHYRSSIKQPTPNYLATQHHMHWPVVYPKISYKIMDQQPSPKIFKESLLQLWTEALVLTIRTHLKDD